MSPSSKISSSLSSFFSAYDLVAERSFYAKIFGSSFKTNVRGDFVLLVSFPATFVLCQVFFWPEIVVSVLDILRVEKPFHFSFK